MAPSSWRLPTRSGIVRRLSVAMLGFDAPLSLGEYVSGEALPLATVFRAIMELLAGRQDAVVFGAHAVNAYVDDEKQRMTGDVDVLSTNALPLAELIRSDLHDRF